MVSLKLELQALEDHSAYLFVIYLHQTFIVSEDADNPKNTPPIMTSGFFPLAAVRFNDKDLLIYCQVPDVELLLGNDPELVEYVRCYPSSLEEIGEIIAEWAGMRYGYNSRHHQQSCEVLPLVLEQSCA